MLEILLEVRCDNCGQRLQIYGPWPPNQLGELRALLADWHFGPYGYARDDPAWEEILPRLIGFLYDKDETHFIKLMQFVNCPRCDPECVRFS